ncbi:MAG: dephospho-CoA kinase [Gammaproteobacteria bacterium]|nr:dephospho-CoA kinase [Gammaproteobacteria bacterium]MDH5800086.1 dephospho-CoA kinase [Gammaproteobacteria bacterium]
MLIIGLTGGIGSGKTTVSDLFHQLGVDIIDTDVIARQLVQPGQEALQQIVAHFGVGMLDHKGRLQREKLRELVHSDKLAREQLEAILHPRIKQQTLDKICQLQAPYCLVVVPLLFESGWQDLFDRILVIDSSQEQQMQRIQQRDQLSQEQASRIMHNQIDRRHRLAGADDVMENRGDISELKAKVEQLHKFYLSLS